MKDPFFGTPRLRCTVLTGPLPQIGSPTAFDETAVAPGSLASGRDGCFDVPPLSGCATNTSQTTHTADDLKER